VIVVCFAVMAVKNARLISSEMLQLILPETSEIITWIRKLPLYYAFLPMKKQVNSILIALFLP
jgi:hypothetical protein